MKKLVTTPLTRTIYWATVDDKRGIITGEKKDVTDNAVECVLNHFIYSSDFKDKGFSGYTYNKSDGEGKLVICAYDDTLNVTVKKSLYDEMKEKCLKYDAMNEVE